MTWDFATSASFQAELDWADRLVREDIEPIDRLVADARDLSDPVRQQLLPPIQKRVKQRGLWACHLDPADGGCGISYVEAALLNEVLGRTWAGPVAFGCGSPDAGNAEILAGFASPEQRTEFLEPLVAGDIMSAFAVTEPQGGGDPTVFETTARLSGDDWVINGEKWFITGATESSFLLVMAVTDPDNSRYRRMSLLLVPTASPGVELVRNIHVVGKDRAHPHAYLRLNDARVPASNLLGERGDAFKIMQARMGIARMFLAMRSLGQLWQTLDMMCERAVSRSTQGQPLADKQLVQAMIAETWTEITQYRLMVLQTAWKIQRAENSKEVRTDISAVKSLTARVVRNTALRAIQLHGSLGVSPEMPFMGMLIDGVSRGIADGPSEVHDVTLGRELLKSYTPSEGLFPTRHEPKMVSAALRRYSAELPEGWMPDLPDGWEALL